MQRAPQGDPAGKLQEGAAEQGDRDREQPGAQAPPVAEEDGIGERAHGAEARALHGRTERGAEQEAGREDPGGSGKDVQDRSFGGQRRRRSI